MTKPQALLLLCADHADVALLAGQQLQAWRRFIWSDAGQPPEDILALTQWLSRDSPLALTIVCDVPDARFQLERMPALRSKERRMLWQRKHVAWAGEGLLTGIQHLVHWPVLSLQSQAATNPVARQAAGLQHYLLGQLAQSRLSALLDALPANVMLDQITLLPWLLPRWLSHWLPAAQHHMCLLSHGGQLSLAYVYAGQLIHSQPVLLAQRPLAASEQAAWLQQQMHWLNQHIRSQLGLMQIDQIQAGNTQIGNTLVGHDAMSAPLLCVHDGLPLPLDGMPGNTVYIPLQNAQNDYAKPAQSGLPPMLAAIIRQQSVLRRLPNLANTRMRQPCQQLRAKQTLGRLWFVVAVVSIGLLATLWPLHNRLMTSQQRLQQETRHLQQQLHILSASNPDAKVQAMADIYAQVQQQFRSPQRVVQQLQSIAWADDGWQLDTLDWQVQFLPVSAQPASSSSAQPPSAMVEQVALRLQPANTQSAQASAGWPALLAKLRALPMVAGLEVSPGLAANTPGPQGDTRLSNPAMPMQLRLWLKSPVAGETHAAQAETTW